jgi:dynein heavy chain
VEWLLQKVDGRPSDAAQVALLVACMQFVVEVENAMDKLAKGEADALQTYLEMQVQQLNALVRLTQRDLTRADRQRIMCMITLDAHNRDVVSKLLRDKAVKKTDFQWQSQLKPRYAQSKAREKDAGMGAEFTICDARFSYGFEYLGNGPRLVITPLTDRIYVTATQALHLHMGCAPAGPAGTGKTETTKDLAAALGKCCYVFNCSPEMDYQSLGNIFKGLASSGSWGCFDEFNRLMPEVRGAQL